MLPVVELPLLLLPGSIEDTDEPMLPAFSRTCSTTRLMTLFLAPPLLGERGGDAFFAVVRRAAVFFPPFRPAAERRADVAFFDAFLEAFFDAFFVPPFRAAERFVERFFDEDRFLDELRDPPFFDAFFEDLRDELFFDAAIFRLLLRVSVGSP